VRAGFNTGVSLRRFSECAPLFARKAMEAAHRHGAIVSYDLTIARRFGSPLAVKQKATGSKAVNWRLLVDVMLGKRRGFSRLR